jgi:hypothetical protein
MSMEKKPKPLKPIDPSFLEEARKRALECLPLTEAQRAEFAILWGRQTNLPKNLRSLATGLLWESGWVLTNLIPGYLDFISRTSVIGNSEYLDILISLKDDFQTNPGVGIQRLVSLKDDEKLDSIFREKLSSALLILDFGLTGFPYVSAILAKKSGFIETSLTLISDGGLSIEESVNASSALGETQLGILSKGDIDFGIEITIPNELLPPDNFNSTEVGLVAPRV